MELPALSEDLIAPFMDTFNTQAFLTRIGSGLAMLKIKTPSGYQYVSEWINTVGKNTQILRRYLLVVLQAEQGLVESPTVRNAAYTYQSLPGKPPFAVPRKAELRRVPDSYYPSKDKPPLPAGWPGVDSRVVRNGGPDFVEDGNWYVAVQGDWKMVAALGMGIPDVGFFPCWDVRKYLGIANQIMHAANLLRKYIDEYGKLTMAGKLSELTVTVYSGETVMPADKQTYALLKYNPDLAGLKVRPAIDAKYRKLAAEWGIA